MNPFRFNRPYEPDLDMRDHQPLAARFSAPPGDGVLSVLVAPRRSGKTWSLSAIARAIGRGAIVVDLRRANLDAGVHRSNDVVLCDEPGILLGDGGTGAPKLLGFCEALHTKGARVVLALTPREYGLLRAADEAWSRLSPKEECFLPRLNDDEGRRLMGRDERAAKLFDTLPARWRVHPGLLELLGMLRCDERDPQEGRACLMAAVAMCSTSGAPYVNSVFNDSLTDAQRDVLRRVARGQRFDEHGHDARLLHECGLLMRGEHGALRLGDPVLAAKLEPLRIHHVSDVHVGPKSADALDVGSGATLKTAGDAAGQEPVRERYVKRLEQLEAQGSAPHVVVISGDLVEWAIPAQYAEFMPWLGRVRAVLERTEHPCLSETQPRALVVGGNHDVNWTEASKPGGERTRHQALADALADVPHPHLERAPATRGVQEVTYDELGVAFALLGSAELGGQVHEHSATTDCLHALNDLDLGDDPTTKRRLAEIRGRLASDPVRDLMQLYQSLPEAAREAQRSTYTKLLSSVARVDPGLVHAEALQAVSKASWPKRVTVKIAVLHHPLSPLVGPELRRYAGLLNAAAVKKTLLDGRFALALHGHAHTGWFAEEAWLDLPERWTLRIASAPSLGSSEVRERHGYNVIEVWPDIDSAGRGREKQIVVRRVVHRDGVWTDEATMGPFAPGVAGDVGNAPTT